ncbi:Uncharacterised protein [Bordetella pertussis]|nr:Uncharacterised protein [Bordetella pertussis]
MRTAGQAHRRRGRRGQGMRARVIDTVARGRRRRDGRNLRRVLLAAALRRLRTFIAALSLGRLRTRVVAALGKLRVPVATVATVSGGRRRALPLIPAALGRLLFPIAIVPRRLRIRIAAVPGRRRPVLATVRRRLGTRLAFLPRWLASAVRIQASSRRFATPPRIGHTGVRPLAFRGRHRILARPTRCAGRRRTRSGRHAGVGTRARTGIRSGRRPADLSYTGQPIFMRAPPPRRGYVRQTTPPYLDRRRRREGMGCPCGPTPTEPRQRSPDLASQPEAKTTAALPARSARTPEGCA